MLQDFNNYELKFIKKKNKILNIIHYNFFYKKYLIIYNCSLYCLNKIIHYPTFTSEDTLSPRFIGSKHISKKYILPEINACMSIYIYFSPLFDKRNNIPELEKGKIYIFKNKKICSSGQIYITTKEINDIIMKMIYNNEISKKVINKFY